MFTARREQTNQEHSFSTHVEMMRFILREADNNRLWKVRS